MISYNHSNHSNGAKNQEGNRRTAGEGSFFQIRAPEAPAISETKVDKNIIYNSISEIVTKFDALFPFYRLSDKDCKRLCHIVYDELNVIDKIFCESKGQYLEVKIYYYGSNVARKFYFWNHDASKDEIIEWDKNEIIMNDDYCLKQLNYNNNQSYPIASKPKRGSFSNLENNNNKNTKFYSKRMSWC